MTERYDPVAAAHYAAYRPPLHSVILRRVLPAGDTFGIGLDVGCGTGLSAVALAEHCTRVYGIDPSPSMLREATADASVTYLAGEAQRIPLMNRRVDIVTFAGSLFYARGPAAGEETRRVCRAGAIVVVYDFEVLLGDVLRRCGIDGPAHASGYDHGVNFSGAPGFTEVAIGRERIPLHVTASELAHVLLSDSGRLDQFSGKYRLEDPFQPLAEALDRTTLETDIYYARYRCVEP